MDNPEDYHFDVEVPLSILFIACMTAILILLFLDSIYESSKPVSINTIKESAWSGCKIYAEKQLQVPHRNTQEYTPNNVTKLIEQNHYQVEVDKDWRHLSYINTYMVGYRSFSAGDVIVNW